MHINKADRKIDRLLAMIDPNKDLCNVCDKSHDSLWEKGLCFECYKVQPPVVKCRTCRKRYNTNYCSLMIVPSHGSYWICTACHDASRIFYSMVPGYNELKYRDCIVSAYVNKDRFVNRYMVGLAEMKYEDAKECVSALDVIMCYSILRSWVTRIWTH